MMNHYKIIILFSITLITLSCANSNQTSIEKYCGYEMSIKEINEISQWSSKTPNAYNIKNGSEIYSEINDSIRNKMPDSIVFELFLIKLTEDEVCIDAYCPPNEKYYENIICTMLKSDYSDLIPKQRKIRVYSYSNPDGSGDSPFETAVKLLK